MAAHCLVGLFVDTRGDRNHVRARMQAGGAFEAFPSGLPFASGSELGCLGSRSRFSNLIESLFVAVAVAV